MYKQFKKETPGGLIGKNEFRDVMKQMGVTDQFLQDLIFNVFDTNKVFQTVFLEKLTTTQDGSINFQEFVTALSVMTRGEPNEKLECKKRTSFFFLIAP